MKNTLALSTAAIGLLICSPVYAGGIISPTGLADTIDWSQLGPEFTSFPSPHTVMSVDGVTVTLSTESFGSFQRLDEGSGWDGIFVLGEALNYNQGSGPVTLTFATPVSAAGAYIQAATFGDFTAEIIVNGTETFNVSGDNTFAEDGTAPFIGWSGGPIKTIQFELTAAGGGDTNEFALGTASLGSTIPEPSTWALMLVGFGLLGGAGYWRRGVSVAA
jgi:hypothetical protein